MRCDVPRLVDFDWHCCPVDVACSRYDPARRHSEVVPFPPITQVYVKQVSNKEHGSI